PDCWSAWIPRGPSNSVPDPGCRASRAPVRRRADTNVSGSRHDGGKACLPVARSSSLCGLKRGMAPSPAPSAASHASSSHPIRAVSREPSPRARVRLQAPQPTTTVHPLLTTSRHHERTQPEPKHHRRRRPPQELRPHARLREPPAA
ncbi:hypothetical protein TCAP_06333, partial [Tolypocladium capitatum]